MRQIQRLRSDWMLVELEPEKRVTDEGIIMPDTAFLEPLRIGRVEIAGPGREYSDGVNKGMPDDIIGKRVAFMILASKTKQGAELRERLQLDDDHELIRLGDCLLMLDDDWKGTLTKT